MTTKLLGAFNPHTLPIRQSGKVYYPPPVLQKKVEKIWSEAKEEYGDRLWNGVNYRLEDIDADTQELILGQTEYKNNYASSTLAEEIQKHSFKDRFNCLYISTLVETADHKFILGVTSKEGIHGRTVSLLGGILNKDEMEINSGEDLLEYAYKELYEEFQLTQTVISNSTGLGIYEMPTARIGIFLRTLLIKDSSEIKEIVKMNDEHDSYCIVTREEILRERNNLSTVYNRGVFLAIEQLIS